MKDYLTIEYFIAQKLKPNQCKLFIDIMEKYALFKNRIPIQNERLEELRTENFSSIQQYEIKILCRYLSTYLFVFETTYNIPVNQE